MKLLPPPGPERKRQLIMLAGLVVVLGIYFGRRSWPTAATPVPTSKPGTVQQSAKAPEKPPLPDPLDLDKLEPAPQSSQTTRNPFQFGVPPPPPAPPPAPYVAPPPVIPPPPVMPPVPQVPLRCTGMTTVTATKQRTALMLDPETSTAQWVVDGFVFDGRYKILKVNAESVVVSFLDGTGQKTVFLER